MLKKITLILLLLGILFTSSVYAENIVEKTKDVVEESLEVIKARTIYKKIEKHTVSIISVNPYFTICSGIIIKEDKYHTYILTCKHCLSLNEEMYADDHKIELIITSAYDDLALLITSGKFPNKTPATLALSNPKKEQSVYHHAYPDVYHAYKARGEVVKYTDDWGWANLTLRGGCSGGGIFNEDAQLVGITWGYIFMLDIALYEPIEDVYKFLAEIKIYHILETWDE